MKRSTMLSTGFRRRCSAGVALLRRVILLLALVLFDSAAAVAETPEYADTAGLQSQAQVGDPWAQLNLGAAYDHGLSGFPQDPAKAVLWYRRAAEAGVAEAQFNLAHCLATGHGIARDDAEALRWMDAAARQGLRDARFLLGVMLANGMGGPADTAAAIDWLGKAAAQGHAEAAGLRQRLLGTVNTE